MMAARRITLRVSNPTKKTKRRAPAKRRRRNPEQGRFAGFEEVSAKHRAKPLPRHGTGARIESGPVFVQGDLAEALGRARIPRVNLRGKGNAPIVILRGSSSSSSKPKRRKPRRGSAKHKRSQQSKRRRLMAARRRRVSAARSTTRAVRKAARKGGNMAKKKSRRRKGSRGRRRVRCIGYQVKKGRLAGRFIARRVNPGIPAPVAAGLAAIVGAAGGIALSYGADKLGVGSPTQRNWGLFGAGLAIAAIGHKFAPGPSASVGTGLATIGLLRQAQTMLYAAPQPMSGLGMGDGGAGDIASAFAQLGQGSVFDRIGAVVDDVGLVVD